MPASTVTDNMIIYTTEKDINLTGGNFIGGLTVYTQHDKNEFFDELQKYLDYCDEVVTVNRKQYINSRYDYEYIVVTQNREYPNLRGFVEWWEEKR